MSTQSPPTSVREADIMIVEAYTRGKVIISKEFRFEASHVLPKHPGKCSRLHGHSWVLTIGIDGFVDPTTGFVVDYGELKSLVQKHIIDVVDHQHLGQHSLEVIGANEGEEILHRAVLGEDFYPSSENLVQAFRRLLLPLVKELGHTWQQVALKYIKLNETCTSECTWVRDH